MTVPASYNINVWQGNDATVTFPFYFLVFEAEHLRVELRNMLTNVTIEVTPSMYTIAGLGNDEGGSITLAGTPISTTQLLIIRRIVPYSQDADIVNQSGFYPEEIEKALDLIVMQIQQLGYDVSRSIKSPVGEDGYELPPLDERRSRFLSFDAAGNLYMSFGTGADYGLREDLATNGGVLIRLQDGKTLQEAMDELQDIPASLSLVAGRGNLEVYNEPEPLEVVAAPSTVNKADPDIADVPGTGDVAPAIGTSLANQLHRVRLNTTGALQAQNPSALPTFCAMRKYDVEPGPYVFSIHRTPLNIIFYPNGFFRFYNADGTLHSYITTGFTVSHGFRQIAFTVPAGAAKTEVTWRDLDSNAGSPLTLEMAQIVHENIMLNKGTEALPYVPYSDGSYTVDPARFDLPSVRKPCLVEKQGKLFYIRQPAQTDLTRFLISRVFLRGVFDFNSVLSRSGVLDFYGKRFAPSDSTDAIAAFNLTTEPFSQGTDESAATRIRAMFVNGQHGSTSYDITVASHDKTVEDVGSVYNDSVNDWILMRVLSATKLTLQRKFTGTVNDYNITSLPPTTNTFTHVSGGTHTANIAGTAVLQNMFYPIIREYEWKAEADGVEITADGAYPCTSFVIHESWKGLNLAKVQNDLMANAGTPTPNYTPDVAREIIYNRHEWDEFGGYSQPHAYRVTDQYTRGVNDYWPVIQLQRPSLPMDSTPGISDEVTLYVPDVGVVAGHNFKAGAVLTNNVNAISLAVSDCDDPNDPSGFYFWIGSKAGVPVAGEIFGYDRTVGLAVPERRKLSTDTVLDISQFEKCYPYLINKFVPVVEAGETNEAVAFRVAFKVTDINLTVPGVVVRSKGKVLCFIVAHKELADYFVSVPTALAGLPITVLKSVNMTTTDGFVGFGRIKINSAGSATEPGWLILQIGEVS